MQGPSPATHPHAGYRHSWDGSHSASPHAIFPASRESSSTLESMASVAESLALASSFSSTVDPHATVHKNTATVSPRKITTTR